MLRSLLAGLLVLALIPATALANTSVWASRTVLDRTTFRTAVVDAIDDPDLRAELARRLTRELYGALIEGDDAARLVLGQVLGLGTDPSDGQVLDALEPFVGRALEDPRAIEERDALVSDAHDALTGNGTSASRVELAGDRFFVDVRALLDAVSAALGTELGGLELTVPADTTVVLELEPAPGLGAARDGLTTLDRLSLVLPLLAILLALLVIVVAHRRARAIGLVGAAAVIAGLAGIAIVLFGGVAIARSGANLDPAVVNGTLGVFSNVLLVQSAALVGVGLVLAFVGAVGSGRSAARRARLAAAHDEADW